MVGFACQDAILCGTLWLKFSGPPAVSSILTSFLFQKGGCKMIPERQLFSGYLHKFKWVEVPNVSLGKRWQRMAPKSFRENEAMTPGQEYGCRILEVL